MALDLSGTPVFITGAGSGIGRATALKFASARADLFLVGRTETKLLETQNQIKELYPDVKVAISAIDVTNKKALEGAVTQAVEHFGGLAVVVSNAGIVSFLDDSFDKWEETVATNLTATMYLCHLVLPHLEASFKKRGHASFIVTSSVLGFLKLGPYAPYAASKHGVTGFTGSLFEAVKDKGIKVTIVNPALTDTPMIQQSPTYNPRASIPPESIAHAIFFAGSFPDGGCPTEITVNSQYSSEM